MSYNPKRHYTQVRVKHGRSPACPNCFPALRTWEEDGIRLDTWDTGRTDHYGKTLLRYELREHGELIFSGDQYAVAPLHAIDSDEAVAGLLSFLSLRKGDTDDEYFADYTERQLRFSEERGEELSAYVSDMEH